MLRLRIVAIFIVGAAITGYAFQSSPANRPWPPGVQKVGENRYRAPGSFDDTLKYYRTVYPAQAFPRKPVVNQPGVKAVHIVNHSVKKFEGLKMYEANDEVRIYIVPAPPAPRPARKATVPKSGKKTR